MKRSLNINIASIKAIYIILFSLASTTAFASNEQWTKKINNCVPNGLSIVEIKIESDKIRIKGTANSNATVSKFMRNISSNKLGHVSLQSIFKNDSGRHFIMEIKTNKR